MAKYIWKVQTKRNGYNNYFKKWEESIVKKILTLFLCVFMFVVLISCGRNKSNDKNSIADNKKVDISSYEKANNGGILISEEEFLTYITKEKLTPDNWKEYFEVCENKEGIYGLHAKNWKNAVSQYAGRNAFIEIKDLKSGQMRALEVTGRLVMETETSYTIEDFECLKIEGTVLIANVPGELWQQADSKELWKLSEDGIPVIYVGHANAYTWYTQEFGVGNDLQDYLLK